MKSRITIHCSRSAKDKLPVNAEVSAPAAELGRYEAPLIRNVGLVFLGAFALLSPSYGDMSSDIAEIQVAIHEFFEGRSQQANSLQIIFVEKISPNRDIESFNSNNLKAAVRRCYEHNDCFVYRILIWENEKPGEFFALRSRGSVKFTADDDTRM